MKIKKLVALLLVSSLFVSSNISNTFAATVEANISGNTPWALETTSQTILSKVDSLISTLGNVKTQTDTLPTLHTTANNIKAQTDKIPGAINTLNAAKTNTDKIPGAITTINGIKSSTDNIGAVKTQTDKIGCMQTTLNTVKSQTDNIAAIKQKVDAMGSGGSNSSFLYSMFSAAAAADDYHTQFTTDWRIALFYGDGFAMITGNGNRVNFCDMKVSGSTYSWNELECPILEAGKCYLAKMDATNHKITVWDESLKEICTMVSSNPTDYPNLAIFQDKSVGALHVRGFSEN